MIEFKTHASTTAKWLWTRPSVAIGALCAVLFSSAPLSASPLKCHTELKSEWGAEFEVLACRVVEDTARVEAYQVNRGHCGPPSFTYPILKDWRVLSKMTASEKVDVRSLAGDLGDFVKSKGKRYSSFNTQINLSAMADDYIQSALSSLYGYTLENGESFGSFLTVPIESATLQTLDGIDRAVRESVIGKFKFGDTVSIRFPSKCEPLEVKFLIDGSSYLWKNY